MVSVLSLVRAAALRSPSAIAVETVGEGAVTYEQLWQHSGAFAQALLTQGRPNAKGPWRVGLRCGRSLEHVVAMLGAWRAGAAWVSIDPDGPRERERSLAARAAVTQVFDRAAIRAIDPRTTTREEPTLAGDDLAYTIFTSGSTGRPKGVDVAHRGLPALVRAQSVAFNVSEGDRCLWVLSVAFDAHVSDVLVALSSGATLVIDPRSASEIAVDWLGSVARARASVCDVAPSVLATFDPREKPSYLRSIIVGGEPSSPEHLRAWAEVATVTSVYGPTEATVCTHLRHVNVRWRAAMVGDAIAGVRESVRDGETFAEASEGELWLSGDCLALGYLDDPALERERFVNDRGARWYRTGDLVRRTEDGLQFLGRIDRQQKLRGQLVAPEEVEAALRALPSVRAAAATVIASPSPRLVAWVELADRSMDPMSLRAELRRRVAGHLVPSEIVAVDALPRTPSSKVAVGELARGWIDQRSSSEFAGDRDVVAALLACAREALSAPSVRADDDLFDLGMDSGSALALVALASRAGLSLSASDLHRARTVARLAKELSPGEGELTSVEVLDREVSVVARVRAEKHSRAPCVLVLGATGTVGASTVRALVQAPERPAVIALVRASSDAAALARLEAVCGRELSAQCLAIDSRAPRWGLDPARWNALAHSVTTLVAASGRVDLVAPRAALVEDNVRALDALVQLARDAGGPRFVSLSTLSLAVSSDAAPGRFGDDEPLSRVRALRGGYAQSKWIAERTVERSVEGALSLRLGLVVGAPFVDARRGDQLRTVLRALARAGVITDRIREHDRVDVTPAGFAGECVARFCLDETARAGRFAVASRRGATWAELRAAIEGEGGPLVRSVSHDAWLEAIARVRAWDARAADIATVSLDPTRWPAARLFASTGWAFEPVECERLMARVGREVPSIDEGLLRALAREAVEAARGEG